MPTVRGYSKRRSLRSRSTRTLKKTKSSKIFFKKYRSKQKFLNYTSSESKFRTPISRIRYSVYSEKDIESFAGRSTEFSTNDPSFPSHLIRENTNSINNFFSTKFQSPELSTDVKMSPSHTIQQKNQKLVKDLQKQESIIFISLNTLKRKRGIKNKVGPLPNQREKPLEEKAKKTPKYQKQLLEKVHRKKKLTKFSENKRNDLSRRTRLNGTFEKIIALKKKNDRSTSMEQNLSQIEEKDSLSKYSQIDVELWPTFEKKISCVESVPKINKRYIESLLQLATVNNSSCIEYSRKSGIFYKFEDENMKKKSSSNIIIELKNKTSRVAKKNLEFEVKKVEYLRPADRKPSMDETKVSSVKVLRVLTKSDNQFKRIGCSKYKKHTAGKPEIKSEKKITDSKFGSVDRKKRKHKNYSTQVANSNEVIQNAASNTADLKELWRRDDRKLSDNSFTSQSTCSIKENEEFQNARDLELESYNKLRRKVHEESIKVPKNFELEKKTKLDEKEKEEKKEVEKEKEQMVELSKGSMIPSSDSKNKSQSESSELKTSIKSFCKRLTTPISENLKDFLDKTENLNLIVKRRIIQGKEQKNLFYDQLKEKTNEYVPPLYKDTSEEIKMKLKRLAEEKTPSTKIPSHIAKTWPLVQRLQKAFIALGTPTFPGKDLDCSPLKVKKNNFSSDGFSKGSIRKNEGAIINDTNQTSNLHMDYLKNRKKTKISNLCYPEKLGDRITNNPLKKDRKPQNVYKTENNSKPPPKPKLVITKNSTINVNKVSDNGDAGSYQKKNCHIGARENQNFNMFSRVKTVNKPEENVKVLNSKKVEVEARYNTSTKKRLELAKKLRDEAGDNFNKKDSIKLPPWDVFRKKAVDEKPLRQKTFEVLPKVIKPRKSDSCSTIESFTESEIVIYSCANRDYSSEEKIAKKIKSKPPFRENINAYFYEDSTLSQESYNDYDNSNKPFYVKSNFPQDKINWRNEEDTMYINKAIKSIFKAKNLVEEESERELVTNIDISHSFLIQNDMQHIAEKAMKKGLIVPIQNSEDEPEVEIFQDLSDEKFEPKLKKPISYTNLQDSSEQSEVSEVSLRNSKYQKPKNLAPQIQIIDITPSNYRQQKSEREKGCHPSVSILSTRTYDNIVISPSPPPESKTLSNKPLWEQDINKYREIVKDIMNQYKRIDGLLTQGHRLDSFHQYHDQPGESQVNKDINKSILFADNCHTTDIQEYRKKIISEYQKLSIFEYKSKLKMETEQTESEDLANFGGLVLVQELNSNNDVDVKDFQPNVHKVLDSQIYVDADSLDKEGRAKGKKFSWQSVHNGDNKKQAKGSLCF